MRVAYCGSKPMPLSVTVRRCRAGGVGTGVLPRDGGSGGTARRYSAATVTTGGTPGRWNFRALLMRFWKSCRICAASAATVGSGPTSTRPSHCATRTSRSESTSRTTALRLTAAGGVTLVVTRENDSRSSMSRRMRPAESSMRVM